MRCTDHRPIELVAADRMLSKDQQQQTLEFVRFAKEGAVASSIFQRIGKKDLRRGRLKWDAEVFEWLNTHVDLGLCNVEADCGGAPNHESEGIPTRLGLINRWIQGQPHRDLQYSCRQHVSGRDRRQSTQDRICVAVRNRSPCLRQNLLFARQLSDRLIYSSIGIVDLVPFPLLEFKLIAFIVVDLVHSALWERIHDEISL